MILTVAKKSFTVFLVFVFIVAASSVGDEKRISIYSSSANYTLPVVDRSGREYVGLLELLEPLGRVSARSEGKQWKLRYNDIDAEFTAGRTQAKVRGRGADLTATFLVENGRGLVPLSTLTSLLPRFLGASVNFRESARRLFVGDIATHVNAMIAADSPARLSLNFTAPVNPTISTESGKLRMVFTRDPLVPPGTSSLTFNDKTITQATFLEANGALELDVLSNAPLMARFDNDGRTITVTATGQPTPPGQSGTTGAASAQAPPGITSQSPSPAPTPTSSLPPATVNHRFLVVVDPAHGGNERGAALSDKLSEKDVTLGFARLLRHELDIRGISVLLLRENDSGLTVDQRVTTLVTSHGALFVTLHAGSDGSGARVFTALLPAESPSAGAFHPWNSAQSPSLSTSQGIAAAIVADLQKQQIPARTLSASLRPLNNLMVPALAVELAPGPNGIADLASANYQQKVSAAIADAVAEKRDMWGAKQ